MLHISVMNVVEGQRGHSKRISGILHNLARRLTLNPVLVIISLVFWFLMWGVPGMILSTPLLAITKIICDRLQPLAAFGHFLEG